ncbi:L-idonate 5-dehydrogenase [Sinomonas cyclohexanicum]|uniref:L-idonate 5-dehydrogenase n=1 Tax=Sinomonas cyclohexanicum TaxID=322009 RepID=A0ABM7PYD0_SINCY|nr:L-idonate 5-dehydrogenase [Corynebacterium cyclohexanicum]BCT77305.1 L-idonate 5-dehydrogenase [Corynebacterium cyclohexanicum]
MSIAVVVHAAGDLRLDPVAEREPGPHDAVVVVEYGGICGSDIHYVKHGAAGLSILREPMVLGHEVAGRIDALGEAVTGFEVGQAVAVHPATVCGECEYCAAGRPNLCGSVAYLGSAASHPHTEGAFSARTVVPADQLRAVPEGVSTRLAAVAEPLGVAIHAVNRACGTDADLRGRTVLVNGAGPIGALVVAAARKAGAAHVVAADLAAGSLDVARRMGAHETVNLAEGGTLPATDVVFEASGVPAATTAVLRAVRRGGTVVQVGNLPAGDVSVSLAELVFREVDYRGTFRFVDEITTALLYLAEGLDVEPMLTHEFAAEDAVEAFRVAGDRSTGSSKVLLRF